MAKILINLLPPEVMARELKNVKFVKIQLIGIAVILFMIFLAALTLALQILQNHNIAVYQAKLTQAEDKAADLKDTQASLFLLENRIKVINQYLGVPSRQSAMYLLIDRLIPASVVINSITIQKDGEAVFLALVPDSVSLDTLISNLTTKDNNEGKIKEVLIESLNRGRDGTYRISFKLKPG